MKIFIINRVSLQSLQFSESYIKRIIQRRAVAAVKSTDCLPIRFIDQNPPGGLADIYISCIIINIQGYSVTVRGFGQLCI